MNDNIRENLKTYCLIFVPLILGQLINSPIIGYYFPIVFSIAFLFFWFYVGGKFAKLKIHSAYSLLIGNSLNIISLLIFIWSFYIVSDEARNLLLAGLSQMYAIPAITVSSKIYMLTNPEVITGDYIVISYILISLVFTLGFFFKKHREGKNTAS